MDLLFSVLIALHVVVCLILVVLILLQPGEGRGLSETFGGGMAESIFGSKASAFLTKSTAMFATLFFVICISLTILTARKTQSVFEGYGPVGQQQAEQAGHEPADSPSEAVKE